MAYEKTIWKNREVERPRTFEKVENPDGTITLVPAEGNIIEEGTPIIAENMNKIEQGIKDAHDDLAAHKADYIHLPYSIADGTNTYTTSINGISSLVEGMSVKIKFTNANTGASTLNINRLGAKAIQKSNGSALSSGNIKAGQIVHLVYTGSVFQLLGEGGEYGTAQPEHVLEGYTIGTEEGLKTGTMPNRGAVTNTITTQGGSYTIPAGYHNGSGKVTANFANLVPQNVKKGVNIGGVIGTYEGNPIKIATAHDASTSYDVTANLYFSSVGGRDRVLGCVAYASIGYYDVVGSWTSITSETLSDGNAHVSINSSRVRAYTSSSSTSDRSAMVAIIYY